VSIVQIERKHEPGSEAPGLVLSWHDSQLLLAPRFVHEAVWAGLCVPVVAFPFSLLFYLGGGPFWPLAVSSLLLVVGFVAWCIRRGMERPGFVRRVCVVHKDGRMEFPQGLPKREGPFGHAAVNVLQFNGVEYSPTAQWTPLDPKAHNVRFPGGWFDVYGTLTDGRRFLLSRNCWDRDTNHEMAIALGTAFRDMQALLKPSPAKAASPAAARARRVID
jgi:hypothetical protein